MSAARIHPATLPEQIADLASQIRAVLDANRADPALAASALSYELASTLAREAVPFEVADQAIDGAAEIMKQQVREFGTGKAHP